MSVHPLRAESPQPDRQLVDTLRELLTFVESGELRGLAYVGYMTDKNIRWGSVGAEMTSVRLRTYGLLHWLAGKIMRDWEDSIE